MTATGSAASDAPTGRGITGPAPIEVLVIRDHLIWSGGTMYFLETLPQFEPARVRPSLCVLQPWSPVARTFEAAGRDGDRGPAAKAGRGREDDGQGAAAQVPRTRR